MRVPNVRYQENLKTKCATQLPRARPARRGKDAAELLALYLGYTGGVRHSTLVDGNFKKILFMEKKSNLVVCKKEVRLNQIRRHNKFINEMAVDNSGSRP